jgi:hypothetical protein
MACLEKTFLIKSSVLRIALESVNGREYYTSLILIRRYDEHEYDLHYSKKDNIMTGPAI